MNRQFPLKGSFGQWILQTQITKSWKKVPDSGQNES